MSARAIAVRLGEVEVLVETTPATVAGSQPTSRAADAADGLADAFDRAQDAILEMATSTAKLIGAAAQRAARPDHFEVEFGLKISVQGNVIIAAGSGEATLRVKLTYDAPAA